MINGARQGGKSTIVSGLPVHAERHERAPYSLVFATSEDQANLVITKAKNYIRADGELVIEGGGSGHILFGTGGQIVALPSTEKTVRGHSSPRYIIMDEASRMPDELVFAVSPMRVDNPRCVMLYISTPAGKRGAFWKLWNDTQWTRIEVKAPWDIQRINGDPTLVPAMPEKEYQALRAKQGIIAFYSPRHQDRKFMERELRLMGERWVRQEYLCEFVELEDSVFAYEDIERAHQAGRGLVPLFGGGIPAVAPLFG